MFSLRKFGVLPSSTGTLQLFHTDKSYHWSRLKVALKLRVVCNFVGGVCRPVRMFGRVHAVVVSCNCVIN